MLCVMPLLGGCQPIPELPRRDAAPSSAAPAPSPAPLAAHPKAPQAPTENAPVGTTPPPETTPPTAAPTPSGKLPWKGVTLTPHPQGPTPLLKPSNEDDLDETDRYIELNPHLKHPPRSSAYVKMPSAYGELILDVDSIDRSYDQIDGMTAGQEEHAELMWAEAKALYKPGTHEASEQAMKALVARYPYWGKGHGALYDLNLHLGRLDEAEYHLKQLIAIQANYTNLFTLAELYVQKGDSAPARAILAHLYDRRTKAPDRTMTLNMLTLYLMVLMDARDANTLYAVADQSVRDYGAEPVLEYHAVLGLVLQQKRELAKSRLANFPPLPPRHPMFAKVQRLKLLVNRAGKKR